MNAAAPLWAVNAVLAPVFKGVRHVFEKGSITVIVTGSDHNCVMLLDSFLGIHGAGEESAVLLGKEVGKLSKKELREIRSRIGVYIHECGLISNLKAVENVTLPLLCNSTESTREIFEKALQALNRAGYDGDPFMPPGRLSEIQRATVSLARVFASDMELVIYDRLGDGLQEDEQETLVGLALDFHQERPDRTTVFLFPNPLAIFGNTPATVLHLSEEGSNENGAGSPLQAP